MLSITKSLVLQGLDGVVVDVEVDISAGLPSWEIVGLPDVSIKESKERVKTAIKNCDIELPSRKYIINLSPAHIRKEGSFFDLAIAVGILKSMGIIKNEKLENIIFIGELSLEGNINGVQGVLPICIEALKFGIKKVIVPKENFKEAKIVKELEIVSIKNLKELILYFKGALKIEEEIFNLEEEKREEGLDFKDVKGQANIKRALEIAAAGGHNCLMVGFPGSGKTMMAKRVSTILPDMTFNEALEVTKIHSIAGKMINNGLAKNRPFRNPHHTISQTGLIGGGRIPKPGEISLAHNGVLFLDELPEFNKNTLEVLRGPLEDKSVSISRVYGTLTYPCNFMLIASMNPCPCGYYGSKDIDCNCTELQVKRYKSKISGPLLDRIDIQVNVLNTKYDDFEVKEEESSKSIRERVNKARIIQINRYKKYNIYSNSELFPKLIEEFCELNIECKKILEKYFEKLKLSARAYTRILKVARTIADLDNSERLNQNHILEAINLSRNIEVKNKY